MTHPEKLKFTVDPDEKIYFLTEADSIPTVSCQDKMAHKPHLARSRQTCMVASVACLVLILLWARCMFSSGSYLVSFGSLLAQSTDNRNFSLFVLPKGLADRERAYCLDGSPPSYYFRGASCAKAATCKSWLVVLQGGGWCWNASDCYKRSLTSLGSSYQLPKTIPFYGIMSSDSSVNPEFYDWNMIMINYCDGASFSGNLEAPVIFNNTNIYYRGAPVLKLTLAYLLEVVGLEKAERIVLGGVSAGGLAAFIHVDYIRSVIPAHIPVHGIVDCGFFLDEKNISGYEHYRFHMQEIFNMQNASGSMNRGCLTGADEKWKCFFAEYMYPYIRTPLFIINSAYDYWQQWFILDLRCHPLECPDKLKFLKRHHETFLHEIGEVYENQKDGMFISSCFAHSQVFHDNTWATYRVQGKTTREAFGDWYFGRTQPSQSRYMDCSTYYDCNPSCAESWTLAFYKNVTDHMKNSTPDF